MHIYISNCRLLYIICRAETLMQSESETAWIKPKKLLLCMHAKTDKELCVCVSRTVEWNPCQFLASLSSLLIWINGNVTAYTHHPVHTHISFARSFHTNMDTVTLHSPSHENTQRRVRDGWFSSPHTPVDLPHSVLYCSVLAPGISIVTWPNRHLASFQLSWNGHSTLDPTSTAADFKLKYYLSNLWKRYA